MLTFFILLSVLLVLVVAAGSMVGGSRRRVIYERSPLMRERPYIEEYVDEPVLESSARTRRVVRRRSY